MAALLVINRTNKAISFPRKSALAVLARAHRLWPRLIKDKKIAVILVGSSESRRLNNTYRKKNKPTNVLSFISRVNDELGDIIICYDVALLEARRAKIKLPERISYLFTHGLLHLLGFDHKNKEQAAIMDKAAKKLCAF